MNKAMAFGSLMLEGCNVRISGQDVGRGTFSQRSVHKPIWPRRNWSASQIPGMLCLLISWRRRWPFLWMRDWSPMDVWSWQTVRVWLSWLHAEINRGSQVHYLRWQSSVCVSPSLTCHLYSDRMISSNTEWAGRHPHYYLSGRHK